MKGSQIVPKINFVQVIHFHISYYFKKVFYKLFVLIVFYSVIPKIIIHNFSDFLNI